MGKVLLRCKNSQKRCHGLYAKIFVSNRINGDLLPDLTKETLQELGITVLGDCLAIIRHSRDSVSSTSVTQPVQIKAPAAKLPQISQEMALQQFRKVLIDWNVFKQITGITNGTQITAQLYSCGDDSVQNSLVNTIADIFCFGKRLAGGHRIDGHQKI